MDLDLSECELETCWGPGGGFGEGEGEFDVGLCVYPRQVEGFDFQFRSGARFDTPWNFHDLLLRLLNPVADDGVLALEVVKGDKVVAVDDFDFLGRAALKEDLHRLDGLLILGEAGSGRVV